MNSIPMVADMEGCGKISIRHISRKVIGQQSPIINFDQYEYAGSESVISRLSIIEILEQTSMSAERS